MRAHPLKGVGPHLRTLVAAQLPAGTALLLTASAYVQGDGVPGMTEFNAQIGIASWYEAGHTTANGEPYDPDGLTAAHPTLPFNTWVRVTNFKNCTSVTVRINDRGPFVKGRIIDMSRGAANALGMVRDGIVKVAVEIVPAPPVSPV
jgi:rare lipoprotein A